MTHKLKVLGLVLVAMFAMSSVSASIASAEVTKAGLFTFNVGAGELASVDNEQIGASTLTVNGLAITCGTAGGTGNPVKTKLSPNEDVVEENIKGPESTDITIPPIFGTSNCHVVIAGLTKTVTVTTNGCAGVFDAKTTETKGVVSNTALITIECPAGKKIEVHAYTTAGTEAGTTCTYDIEAIAANTTVPGVTLENKINTPMEVNDMVNRFKINFSLNNTVKSPVCGQNATESVVAQGEATLRATDEAGKLVDISVSS